MNTRILDTQQYPVLLLGLPRWLPTVTPVLSFLLYYTISLVIGFLPKQKLFLFIAGLEAADGGQVAWYSLCLDETARDAN
jgi:hypothetical protein